MLRSRILRLMSVVSGFAWLLTACSCRTSPPAAPLDTDAQLQEALTLLKTEGPEVALPHFEEALAAYRDVGDAEAEAIVLGYVGVCYKNLGEYRKAIGFHTQALELKRSLGLDLEVAKTLSNLGLTYWDLGEYEPAAANLEESLKIARGLGDQRIEAAAVNNLGLVYDEWGDYRRSLQSYRRALKIQQEIGTVEDQAYTLGNIGGVHFLLGDFQKALDYYEKALELSRKLEFRPSEVMDLGNVAICHLELGEVDQALQILDEALDLAERTGQLKEQAYWHSGKGSAFSRLGRYNEALREYQRAFEIYGAAQAKGEIIETLGQIGSVELLLGDVASSERRFSEALALARVNRQHRAVTNSLISLGESARLSGRLKRAEQFLDEGLGFSRDVQDMASEATSLLDLAAVQLDLDEAQKAADSANQAALIAREIGARPREALALKLRADAELQLGLTNQALHSCEEATRLAVQVGDPELLWQTAYSRGLSLKQLGRIAEAVVAMEEALQMIESSRYELETSRHRAGFLDQRYEPYLDLIALLVELEQDENALAHAERLRASLWLDRKQEVEGPRDPSGKELWRLRSRLRYLRSLIREELQKPKSKQRPRALAIYQAELAKVDDTYRQHLQSADRVSIEGLMVGVPVVPTIQELQRRLPRRAALLEYLQTEHELFIFGLTRSNLEVFRLDEGEEAMGTLIEILLDLIGKKSQGWLEPSMNLYDLLIQPARDGGLLEGVDSLFLVPHSNLHYLPFAVLADRQAGGSRFLIDDFSVSYLPSAALLASPRTERKPTRQLLALAPNRVPLEFTREEIQRVSQLFGDDALVLEGSGAKEQEFLRRAPDFRVIHLATHASFNKLNPLQSALTLEKGGGEDGRLEVSEVMGMDIRAELVTLSACETALGGGYFKTVPPGDDFVGLTRAFLAAGSRSVLATLWRVNDRSTLEFMTAFYSAFREQAAPQAMVSAQKRIRKLYHHPYYWAPFVLVSGGDVEAKPGP